MSLLKVELRIQDAQLSTIQGRIRVTERGPLSEGPTQEGSHYSIELQKNTGGGEREVTSVCTPRVR